MKIKVLLRVGFTIGLAVFFISATNAQTPSPQTPALKLADLSWLSGDWPTAPGGGSQTDEHWTQAAGSSMMGLSRTVSGGQTKEFEYLRIEQRPDGIYYVAHPQGRFPGTDFKLTTLGTNEAVFENRAHDFPRCISYRLTPEGSLIAKVDGGPGSNKAFTFTYLPFKK